VRVVVHEAVTAYVVVVLPAAGAVVPVAFPGVPVLEAEHVRVVALAYAVVDVAEPAYAAVGVAAPACVAAWLVATWQHLAF
jgi:hypothetical protein